MMNEKYESVLSYHNRTKHRLNQYAKGPESIDWEDQPNQFRRFSGCEIIRLPQPGIELEPLFCDLDNAEIPAKPLNSVNVGLLLELAFGLSAWKQFGSNRWALRCNPSSGNLHPTEAYMVSIGNDFIQSGVYHYLSHDHSLERRCLFSGDFQDAGLLIGLSSIHWREAWKYGERAYRYCQHDIGHALGALSYAAAALGWSVELCAEWSDTDINQLLGLDRDDFIPLEHESPDIICKIHTQLNNQPLVAKTLLEAAQFGEWFGKADSLGANHRYHWPIINEISTAARKPKTIEPVHQEVTQQYTIKSSCIKSVTQIIRQRRSAQQFNPKASLLPKTDFYRMLAAVLPTTAAFELWRWPPKIHLFIFVHNVDGLTPGIYVLLRYSDALEKLQAATLSDFDWQKVSETIPLYHLHSGDYRQVAKTLSCHQSIASDSAFSLGMVAEFSESIDVTPWLYRRLYWECGLVGQVLYLEAEALGVRGTGIGCYFDDSVHELLGIKDDKWQSLYHFTVGMPLEDHRLETLPGYAHLGSYDIV
jgi:SagB-type dehydrogenase family enzyme